MRSASLVLVVEVAVRWRRDDRPAPDDRRDQGDDAENWLSEFRGQSVRPEALTAADRDAAGRQAAQVGSRRGQGEPVDRQPGREEHRTRMPDASHPETGRSAGQPATRPGPPRADLERDVGPWAGVQRAPEPEPDGSDRRPARRRELVGWSGPLEPGRPDRTPADDPDTDEFARLERGDDRPAADGRRLDPRTADPGSTGGDRRAASAARPDRAGRAPGPDGLRSGDGRGGVPAGPDGRRPGPDARGYDGNRPDRWGRPGREDDRGRVAPGHGADGPAGSLAPLPTDARPADAAARRELPGSWSDPGRQGPARPPRPGGVPSGESWPDQHGHPGGRSDRGDARRDAAPRPAQGRWRDEPPAEMHGPWQHREHEPGGRPGAGPWLPSPDRSALPGSGRPAGRALPPAADRALPPGADRALPPGADRALPSAADRALPSAADRALPRAAGRGLPPAAGRARPPDRPRTVEPGLRALPAPGPESVRPESVRPESVRPESVRPESGRPESGRPEPAQLLPQSEPVQPAARTRPELAANLSLADLERVRQALALLSDEPAAAPGPTAAPDGGPVPSSVAVSPSGRLNPAGSDDDADTTPLPVILPGAAEVPRPEQVEMPRGPFEPARSTPTAGDGVPAQMDTEVPASANTVVPGPEATAIPAEAESAEAESAEAESAGSLPPAAAEKLDQIKDLLITAEAIGEANLDQHFERVSQRQRELIREFFERAMPGQEPQA